MALRKEGKPRGANVDISLDQALELDERLLVEDDVVEVGGGNASRLETIVYRSHGKIRIMLLACEALFLRGGNDIAVDDEGRRAIVVEGGDA